MSKGCPDYINDLNDYVDGAIDPELCKEIEAHLGQCRNCRVMVDTLRQTVRLCCEGKEAELPPALEARLSSILKRRWEQKFGPK